MERNLFIFLTILFNIMLSAGLGYITYRLNMTHKNLQHQCNMLLENKQDILSQNEIKRIKAQIFACIYKKQNIFIQQSGLSLESQQEKDTNVINGVSDKQIMQYISKKRINCLMLKVISSCLLTLQVIFTIYKICVYKEIKWVIDLFKDRDIISYLLAMLAVIVAIVIAVIQYNINEEEQKRNALESETVQKLQNAETIFREQQVAGIVLNRNITNFSKLFDTICLDAQILKRQCINVKCNTCYSLDDCDAVILKLQSNVGGLSCYDWANVKITINTLSCHVINIKDTVCVLCIKEKRDNVKVKDLLRRFSLRNTEPICIICTFDGICDKAAANACNLFSPDDKEHIRYWEMGFSCEYIADTLQITSDNTIKAVLHFNKIQFLNKNPQNIVESTTNTNEQNKNAHITM